MTESASIKAIVFGHVQGVFFRAFIAEHAKKLGLTGFTCNAANGVEVEVEAEGDKDRLEKLIEHLKIGPPSAKVENVTVNWGKYSGKYHSFGIRR
jgi:acylphosphatase